MFQSYSTVLYIVDNFGMEGNVEIKSIWFDALWLRTRITISYWPKIYVLSSINDTKFWIEENVKKDMYQNK